jgi:DNA-binding MurR/RpiR family transcriptional regulator
MIIERLHNQSGFTENEKIIAEYILNHMEDVQQLTADELAKVTLTSKSSIVRLCKKLGIAGYLEFKKLIFAEVTMERKSSKTNELSTLSDKSKYSDYVKNLDWLYESVMEQIKEQLNHNEMKRVINQLNQMERIEFYSSGLGHSIGEATAHKYSGLGIESTAFSSVNEGFLATNKSNSKTAAFVISLSGKNPSVIQMAKILQKYGIYVVGIVGNRTKEMEKYCNEVVLMAGKSVLTGTEHAALVLSANYIFDLIFIGLLSKRYNKQVELLKIYGQD